MTNGIVALLSVSITINVFFFIAGYMTISDSYHLMQVQIEQPTEEVTLESVYNQ